MKKIIGVVIGLFLLFGFSACMGNMTEEPSEDQETTENEEVATEEVVEETAESTEEEAATIPVEETVVEETVSEEAPVEETYVEEEESEPMEDYSDFESDTDDLELYYQVMNDYVDASGGYIFNIERPENDFHEFLVTAEIDSSSAASLLSQMENDIPNILMESGVFEGEPIYITIQNTYGEPLIDNY
ncbi:MULTISPECIES: hypothetical protein [unclassified Bacillus (in: firmicutes)]|uniref:hypothetical protein n=1 Tax=unclassified Bacillus (in: firmicutes) TaxID=185979 RepID=UPI0008E11B2E|nr:MULTISPECIES: hypothetical protein [unclassified Bacillus (in: firmicutes)]SFB20921.1 hypothetical protein SAMN02799634_108142 [Bacillus sp. UNCCL13]SFQ90929.1 hypothetical protein SAMN04488577_3957 [Bacillus sp. cl95]